MFGQALHRTLFYLGTVARHGGMGASYLVSAPLSMDPADAMHIARDRMAAVGDASFERHEPVFDDRNDQLAGFLWNDWFSFFS